MKKSSLNDFSDIASNTKAPEYQWLVETIIYNIELDIGKTYENTHGIRILILLNELSYSQKTFFNALTGNLPENTITNLLVHHGDPALLQQYVHDHLGLYDHYLIAPCCRAESEAVKIAINRIPEQKLILLNDLEGVKGSYSCFYEDIEKDIFNGLASVRSKITKYKRLFLVFPDNGNYDSGLQGGFRRFCMENDLCGSIIGALKSPIQRGDLYITVEDATLVNIIKQVEADNLKLGTDVGMISCNDSAFNDILAGGISVLRADFTMMGKTVAGIILNKRRGKFKNRFFFLNRNSV